jgi:pimeloyl-ACP methyl ester carboxylesterase
VQGDRVIRFAQNCQPRSGSDVRAIEITELTPTRYSERPLADRPILTAGHASWNAAGMHHIDVHRLDDGRWLAAVDGRDVRALSRYRFDAERWRGLDVPVLLQIRSESPRHFYVTDALAPVLPNARVEVLPGQPHEGMTTAPEMYTEAVTNFLLGSNHGTLESTDRWASNMAAS